MLANPHNAAAII